MTVGWKQATAAINAALDRYEATPHEERGQAARLSLRRAVAWSAAPWWVPEALVQRAREHGLEVGRSTPAPGQVSVVLATSSSEGWLGTLIVEHAANFLAPDLELAAGTGLASSLLDGARRSLDLLGGAARLKYRNAEGLSFRLLDLEGSPVRATRIDGGSLGGAALVATVSLLSGLPVDPKFVPSFEIRATDGLLGRVGFVQAKLAEVSLSGGRLLCCPVDGSREPHSLLDEAFDSAWKKTKIHLGAPEARRALTWLRDDVRPGGAWTDARWRETGELLAAFLDAPTNDDLPLELRIMCAASAGSCHSYVLEHEAMAKQFADVVRLLDGLGPPESLSMEMIPVAVEALMRVSEGLRDTYRFEEGVETSGRALALASAERSDGWLRGAAESAHAQMLLAVGRFDEALVRTTAALDCFHRSFQHRHECSRNHVGVGEILSRLERYDDADREWATGEEHSLQENGDGEEHAKNVAFIRNARLQAAVRRLRSSPDADDVEHWIRVAEKVYTDSEMSFLRMLRTRALLSLRAQQDASAVLELVRQTRARSKPTSVLEGWWEAMPLIDVAIANLRTGGQQIDAHGLVDEALAALPEGSHARKWFDQHRPATVDSESREALALALARLAGAEPN